MQTIKDSIKTIIISSITLSLISVAYAWTEPTSNPPMGNASAPINASDTTQYKSGALGVGGLFTSDSKILINDKTAEPGIEIFNMNTDNQDVGQRFHIGNLAWYSMGLDRSDGGKFKINYGPNVGDTNQLTIDTAGNVGIGQKLNVDGDTIVGYNGNASIFTRHINGKQVGSNTADTLYVNYGQSGYGMNVGNASTNNNPLNVYGPGYFSGNVGIGTANPLSKLSVGGSGSSNFAIYGVTNNSGMVTGDTRSGIRGSMNNPSGGELSFGMLGYFYRGTQGFINNIEIHGVHGETNAADFLGTNQYGVYGRAVDAGVKGEGGATGVYGVGLRSGGEFRPL